MINGFFIIYESFLLLLLTEEIRMKTVGQKIEAFAVTGVKPGFNQHEEKGVSAFEPVTEKSFPGKWKVIYFYPKDFTFVCPTEIVGFAKLAQDFADRDAVVLGGSTDNEFAKLGWRRDHADLKSLNHWQFADVTGSLVDQLGVRDAAEGVALRATFVAGAVANAQRASLTGRSRQGQRRSATRCQYPRLRWTQHPEAARSQRGQTVFEGRTF